MSDKDPYISVKNWEKFQHYHNRRPPWIKLYVTLIDNDDPSYSALPDVSKILLVHLWLLASRHENKIPLLLPWLEARLNLSEKPDLQPLVKSGFITIHPKDASKALAACYQDARPETETETEGEKRRYSSEPEASDSKQPQPHQRVKWDKRHHRWEGILEEDKKLWALACPAVDIEKQLSAARVWVVSNPKKHKKNWYRFLTNWMGRAQEKGTDFASKKPTGRGATF
jgi:hypothetical protein